MNDRYIDINKLIEEADLIAHELFEPPEYFPSARNETMDKLYEIYKKEGEKLKEYAAFDRTLREIESLPELDIPKVV